MSSSGPMSASAIVAPVVGSGSHILRIEGYSATKGLGNGGYINSEVFVAAGHSWRLRYCPDGTDYPEVSHSICFGLAYADVREVEAKFTISLLDRAGNRVPSYSRTCRSEVYKPCCSINCELIERSDLEGSVYLKDDAFTVRCDVALVKKVFTKTIPVSEALNGVAKQER